MYWSPRYALRLGREMRQSRQTAHRVRRARAFWHERCQGQRTDTLRGAREEAASRFLHRQAVRHTIERMRARRRDTVRFAVQP